MQGASNNLHDRIGGSPAVRSLVDRFYDIMERSEPALAALHEQDSNRKISRAARDRFALFLIGWLGGPDDYVKLHGHPRLRMRHAHVPIDDAMRDAWLRCMSAAMEEHGVSGDLRALLDRRFAEIADSLRNVRREGGASLPIFREKAT